MLLIVMPCHYAKAFLLPLLHCSTRPTEHSDVLNKSTTDVRPEALKVTTIAANVRNIMTRKGLGSQGAMS
jgi:hypothetical protein